MKDTLAAIVAVVGGGAAALFGGWDTGIAVLLTLMLIDLITGITAAIMNKSDKTDSGGLHSFITWKGLVRKITTLTLIVVAYNLDKLLGTSVIRDGCVIFFVFNEGTSILENCGRIGIPLPSVIKRALDILHDKSENVEINDTSKK